MSAARLRPVAVALLYAFAIASPFSLGAATAIGLTLLAGGLVVLATHAPARRALPTVVVVAVLGLVVWSAIATATAAPFPVKWRPWANELWIKILMLAVVALLVATRARVDRLLLTYLTAASVVALFGIWQHFHGTIPFQDDIPPMKGDRWEIEAFYNHHLTYGGHVVALWLVAVARALLAGRGDRPVRFLLMSILTSTLLGIGLVWSYARSAQLAGVVGLVFLAAFLPPRRRLGVGIFLGFGVIATLATPTLRERFAEAFDLGTEQTRLNLWRSSIDAIEAHPWTGCGVGNFGEMLEVFRVPGEYDTTAHAHNDYLMHAVNAGLPALVFALLLAGGILVVLIRSRGRDPVTRWIVLAVASAHVALAAGGLVQVFQTDDEVEMTLYFLVGCALAQIARSRGRGDEPGAQTRA